MLIFLLHITGCYSRLSRIRRAARPRLLLAAPLLLCYTLAQARDTIIWANLDFPPWMILQGDRQGQGVWDLLLGELKTQLPDYDHQMVEMNNMRYEQLAMAGKNVCKVYYFKTPERERVLYFSRPATVFLSNHIVMRRDKAALLGYPARLSLLQLMQDPRFDGSFIEGRSYGNQNDNIIRRFKDRAYLHSNVTSNQNLFEFLYLGRTDYILEFPAVQAFFEHTLSIQPEFVNIAIEEAAPYNITYVTCVRNAWGLRVIGRVNQTLRRITATPDYRAAMLRWYRPADQKQLSRFLPMLSPDSTTLQQQPFRP